MATVHQPLRAPFPWMGGKRRVASLVWERFGDVGNYVEPFAGSLAVLLARPHDQKTETVNDADAYLANFWRAVQHDPDRVAAHADWPVNEADLHARHRWLITTGAERVERLKAEPDFFDAQVAGWWVWGLSQWIGSGWCVATANKRPQLSRPGRGLANADTSQQRPIMNNAGEGIHARTSLATWQQVPHIGGPGRGVHRVPGPTPDISERIPHLGNSGMDTDAGVSQRLPHVSDGGTGVHRLSLRDAVTPQQIPELYADRGVRTDAAVRTGTGLVAWMRALCERLRRVRVCCGDWSRVMGPSVTWKQGMTAVFLDPPYAHAERDADLYRVDHDIAADVRAWAIANGDNPLLRIALCGYEGEHEMPASWSVVAWKAAGGYGSQGTGRGRANAARERIWFSPACLSPEVRQLALL